MFSSLERGQRERDFGTGGPGLGYLAELGPRHRHNQIHPNLLCPSSVPEASEHLRQKGPFKAGLGPSGNGVDPRATRLASQELWLLAESSNFA